jgi:hypothetical protein
MPRSRAIWIGAAAAGIVAVLLAITVLPNLLSNPSAVASPPAAAKATRAPPSGAVATVAALATAVVSPRESLPGTTTAPAATALPGPTPTVAAPQAQQRTPVAEGPLRTILDERWTGPRRWPDNPQSTAWYATSGAYLVFAREPGQFVAIGAPLNAAAADVVVSGTFRKIAGPPGGGYGLIVRDQGPGPRDGVNQLGRFYVLEAGDRGEFGIWRREGDRWVDLIPWTSTEAVHTGDAANELVVRTLGPDLTFLINGITVATQTDAAPRDGGVGIFVGGDENQVALDHFAVQVPE